MGRWLISRSSIRIVTWAALFAVFLAPQPALAAPGPNQVAGPTDAEAPGFIEPRTILALYDSRNIPDPRKSWANRYAAMPLNQIGLKVRFWDLAQGQPDAAAMDDVRGVLAWLYNGAPLNAKNYLNWANQAVDAGYRYLVMGNITGSLSESADQETFDLAKRLIAKLGVRLGGRFVASPYRARYPIYDKSAVGLEWDITKGPEGFQESGLATGVSARAFLTVDAGPPLREQGVLVATSVHGGYVQASHEIAVGDGKAQWIIDPFTVMTAAFAAGDLPKPDTTTAVGRRIYYSHIDGDGWRNLSTVNGVAATPVLAADVIFDKAIRAYQDLPVTVAPVMGDLDPDWFGAEPALEAARRIFAHPNVEAAHHTYSHPFAWGFFEDYDAELEKATSTGDGFGRLRPAHKRVSEDDPLFGYDQVRAYMLKPFDLHQEIVGAKQFLESILPPGKSVELVQWSGDTLPFPKALQAVELAGLLNINGGDTRYDPEYPSISTVAPIGVQIDGGLQIYASASNENTYTGLWTRRFYGFRFLQETLRGTEAPRRLKPINIYYHMYTGAKSAALKALLQNLDAARATEIAPIKTSDFVRIAEGFFTTGLERLADGRWRIRDRGNLNTIRFSGLNNAVDYARSQGILGHRFVNSDLYVALDPVATAPLIALQPANSASSARPVLEQGRWLTERLVINENGFAFNARGYGDGAYLWRAVQPGGYVIEARRQGQVVWSGAAESDQSGTLAFSVQADAVAGVSVTVRHRSLAGRSMGQGGAQ